MKKFFAVALLSSAAVVAPAHAALVVGYTGGASAQPVGTTVIQNFDALAPGSSLGTNATVYDTNVSGQAARPAFDSTGGFGTVLTGGVYEINFAASTLFSFVLGSLDQYNSLELLFSSGPSTLLSGSQIVNGLGVASGSQTSIGSNGRVNYSVEAGDPSIIGAIFRSGGNSFEFDNLATNAVPEPTTWAMMLAGFGAMGVALRRRRRVAVSFA
ncbi:PEPxxWA-CTERM sorting domain-containing protein [Sphingobium subterraneum]|uniref:Ice-binding protein C-terminal domain-containing protein n=1 Tax=Sphingobium subterraneum TaxID=627688 RepID=A0A841J1R1_9SPHN|nr:PEPxxWA-CTERM sorting domain-containing protein [Sphingobium subterraneum]MBB6122478.1 hypothetical protein [Sphingobium subterraneum]